MFGMGFMEIFLVLIVAIIALGPEKLPGAAVDIVKFFKKFKSSIDDAKSTLDNELNISQMKEEADKFKSSVSNIRNITTLELDEIANDTSKKKKPKEEDEKTEELTKQTINDMNQFKSKKEKKSLQDKEA
ncbi:MAG: Sec-independent protein translocase protein TatB [Arcobacteraceae bacterium]